MALIAIGSDKGSPGVTTTTVALAACWPRRAVVAETDPSGGDLVYRTPAVNGGPLDPNRGMLSIATVARRGFDSSQVWEHVQQMSGGLEVITGLSTSEQSAGLVGLWGAIGRALDNVPDTDVFADCGRLTAESPAVEMLPNAAVVILVARASAEQVAHVRDRVAALSNRLHGTGINATGRPPIGVLLIVDPKQRRQVVGQVDQLLKDAVRGAQVVGTIADDPEGAGQLAGRRRGRLDKSMLIRSAREVALEVHGRYGMAYAGQG